MTEAVGEQHQQVGNDHSRPDRSSSVDRGPHLIETSLVTRRRGYPSQTMTREVQRLRKLMLQRQCELSVRQLAHGVQVGTNHPRRRDLMAQRLRHVKWASVLLRVDHGIAE